MSNGYRNLDVWNKGYDLTLDIYRMTKVFPKEETYGLQIQMRRASVSIVANLAEGYGRSHTKEFIRYVLISIGSHNELEVHLLLSRDLGYFTKQDYDKLKSDHARIGRMLNGLKKGLYKKLKELKNISES